MNDGLKRTREELFVTHFKILSEQLHEWGRDMKIFNPDRRYPIRD